MSIINLFNPKNSCIKIFYREH